MTGQGSMPRCPSDETVWGRAPVAMPLAVQASYDADRIACAQARWRAVQARQRCDPVDEVRHLATAARLTVRLADLVVFWSHVPILRQQDLAISLSA